MKTIASRDGDKAKVSSVLLLTDGLANVGITKRDMILDEMRKILDPPPGNPVSKQYVFITIETVSGSLLMYAYKTCL